ncbi:MAG: cytochrome c oxidase subunit II [Gammaproteobacteria bacterium]|nr:cytochrome c oxidase subunit II [Gammaproteobacteria bacterium]
MAGKVIRKWGRLLSGLTLTGGAGSAFAEYGLNMTQGVTNISQDIYDLHMLVMWICIIVGIGVFGVIIYSLINHRKSKGAVAANFHENTTVEVIWTAIPLIILVAIAVPATKTLLEIEDTSNSDLSIKVTALQWKWKYDYLDSGVNFISSLDAKSNEARALNSGIDPNSVENYLLNVDKPIVIPVGKKVRFLFTSEDVIHAWWVPDLAVKRDAIPGFINESWTKVEKAGVYRGQCAELCGKDHGFMPIVVHAVPQAEYDNWVAGEKLAMAETAAASSKTLSKDELMARGEQAYNSSCASCHMANGTGIPGVFPGLAGSKIATGPVAEHLDIVIHGSKKNPAMGAFGKQMNDLDLAAIITYERNAWGNNTGDVVQPSDVKAAR